MKVEIWSDVVCPFCYIGKRNFEAALKQFNKREDIDVSWKSFQLDPTAPENSTETVFEYLATRKGISVEESMQMHNQVASTAANTGLTYDFENAVVANTLKAHCLLQLAKENGFGGKVKEELLKAYFTEGKNIGLDESLIAIGQIAGLKLEDIKTAVSSDDYRRLVNADIQEAQNLGVSGVPFFVVNRKYGISGAQPIESMLATIEKAYVEWKDNNHKESLDINQGESCGTDGNCD